MNRGLVELLGEVHDRDRVRRALLGADTAADALALDDLGLLVLALIDALLARAVDGADLLAQQPAAAVLVALVSLDDSDSCHAVQKPDEV